MHSELIKQMVINTTGAMLFLDINNIKYKKNKPWIFTKGDVFEHHWRPLVVSVNTQPTDSQSHL